MALLDHGLGDHRALQCPGVQVEVACPPGPQGPPGKVALLPTWCEVPALTHGALGRQLQPGAAEPAELCKRGAGGTDHRLQALQPGTGELAWTGQCAPQGMSSLTL